MDTTPTPKMFEAMKKFTDAMAGDAPSPLEVSVGANVRRQRRAASMDFLHMFASLCMREGVNRAIRDARQQREYKPDAADRSAMAKAVDDAQAGRAMVEPLQG